MTRALGESADGLAIVSEAKTLPDLQCEPGQLFGPLQPKSLVKIFGREGAGVDFGLRPETAVKKAQLICGVDPQNHFADLELVAADSSRKSILAKIPSRGPCEGHGEGTWHFTLKVTFEDDEIERTSGPLHVVVYWDERGKKKQDLGYPPFPTVPGGAVLSSPRAH